jgi:hypothetical protein
MFNEQSLGGALSNMRSLTTFSLFAIVGFARGPTREPWLSSLARKTADGGPSETPDYERKIPHPREVGRRAL